MTTPHGRSRQCIKFTSLIIIIKQKLIILRLGMRGSKIGRIEKILLVIGYNNRQAIYMLMMYLLLIRDIRNKFIDIFLGYIYFLTE